MSVVSGAVVVRLAVRWPAGGQALAGLVTPPRGSVFPDVGRGARWMDSGPTRRDVIPADGNVFHDAGTPTPQTVHSTLIVGPAGDLGEQRRGRARKEITRSFPVLAVLVWYGRSG